MTDGPVRWIATPRCHPQLSHSRILAIRARHSTCVPAGHRPQRPGLLGGTTARHRILADSFRPQADPEGGYRALRLRRTLNSGALRVPVRRRRGWRSSLADFYRNRDTTRDDARCVLEGDRQGDVNTDIFLGRSLIDEPCSEGHGHFVDDARQQMAQADAIHDTGREFEDSDAQGNRRITE